jgi:hypothetical protein
MHTDALVMLKLADDLTLSTGPELAKVRWQAGVVRALLHHIDRVARAGAADGRDEQLLEEVARLRSCREPP